MAVVSESKGQELRRTIILESIGAHDWTNITFTDDGLVHSVRPPGNIPVHWCEKQLAGYCVGLFDIASGCPSVCGLHPTMNKEWDIAEMRKEVVGDSNSGREESA